MNNHYSLLSRKSKPLSVPATRYESVQCNIERANRRHDKQSFSLINCVFCHFSERGTSEEALDPTVSGSQPLHSEEFNPTNPRLNQAIFLSQEDKISKTLNYVLPNEGAMMHFHRHGLSYTTEL